MKAVLDTLTAKADYLVTADTELLALGNVQDVKIVNQSRFERLLPAETS